MGSPPRQSHNDRPAGAGVACLICRAACNRTSDPTIYLHPESPCAIRVVNEYGASSDGTYERIGDDVFMREPDPDLLMGHQLFTPVDVALHDIFLQASVPPLGGTSGVEGWSSISEYQRCPYSWARSHVPGFAPPPHQGVPMSDRMGKGAGSVVHALLAVHYQLKITPRYPLTPKKVIEGLHARSINNAILDEAKRLFSAYSIYYRTESLQPLWPERLFISPTSRRSCRVDLGVLETNGEHGHPEGLYLMDHKTAQRFDDVTLTGWHNDGGIIQQADIFQECWAQDKELQKHGPLRGVIVNLIGKQKEPDFHRAFVHPDYFQVDAHRQEAPYWQAARNLALATRHFPRARAGCKTQFGKCSHWDHCLTGEG